MLALGDVTTYVLQQFAAVSEFPVGDGVAPPDAGWPEGTPNSAGAFVPYFVLSMMSTGSFGLNPLCSTVPRRFDVTMRLVAYEHGRAEADALAYRGRGWLLGGVGPGSAGDLSLTGQVWLDAVSGAVRDDSTFPQLWSSATTFRVSVANNAQ